MPHPPSKLAARRFRLFCCISALYASGVGTGCSAKNDSHGAGGEASGGRDESGGATAAGGSADRGGTATGGNTTGGDTASGGARNETGGAPSQDGGATHLGGAGPGSSGGAATGGNATGGSVTASGANSGGAGGVAGANAMSGGRGGSASSGGQAGTSAEGGCESNAKTYDQLVLCEKPVGYWAMTVSSGASEADLSGKGSTGQYEGPTPAVTMLPNGDRAATFNGASNYLTIPSKPAFSIPTSGNLSWEAWISPAVLQFPNDSGGYVDWMGKCADYSPTCEWEARMYNSDNAQSRCNRLSAYVFNPSAGLGSGADFQPTCGLFQANAWLHVVGEYTLLSQPSDCQNAQSYPGAIEIWVNGVKWNHSRHGQTGCFSQYQVVPKANDSPINVGTMAGDAWFQGAIGKVAIYDFLLSQAQITSHYRAMTGKAPTGSCADTCSF